MYNTNIFHCAKGLKQNFIVNYFFWKLSLTKFDNLYIVNINKWKSIGEWVLIMCHFLKGKTGALFIATSRFRNLGSETVEGSYELRKKAEAEEYILSLKKFCDVIYPGPVYTREDLLKSIKIFKESNVDSVFALFLSWSEDFSWVRFLRDMPPVPILFVCKTRDSINFDNTTEETDFVEFLSAGGLVGTLEASGSITRINRPMMEIVIGQFDEIMTKARDFSIAAALRTKLFNCNFGLLPSYNEVMWSTYVDPYNLFVKAGPELRFMSVATLTKEINSIDDKVVTETCAILSSKYEVMQDVDMNKFQASVRASLAIESMARKAGVSVVVLNDVDPVLLTDVGLRPGFLPCPGTEDVIVVPEGDIGGGLAVYILKLLSGQPVNFIEPFHIDAKNNCFAAGHAGPNDYTNPAGSVKIACDVRFAKTSYKYAGAPFAWYVISPGIKTLLHVSEANGRFKMICSLVEALPTEHFITSYSHGQFRPVNGSIQDFFAKLLHIGVTQHYGVVEGDYINQLSYLAKILDFDFTII
jgi:L-arabinose isomerase